MQDTYVPKQHIPQWVTEIENSLLQNVIAFLKITYPNIQDKYLAFLCAPWVHFFSHGVLHRYEINKKNFHVANSFNMIDSPPPGDTLAFLELSRTADYQRMLDKSLIGETISFKCRNDIETISHSISITRSTATCYKTGFTKKYRYLIPWLSFGAIRLVNTSKKSINHPYDPIIRERFSEYLSQRLLLLDKSLNNWISGACSALFPVAILERLGLSWQEKIKLPKQKILFSTNAWDIIDEWKIYAVTQKSRHQTKWVGAPHALNHGSLNIFWQREFELNHLDIYLTWGWKSTSQHHAHLINFHPPHFPQKLKSPPKTIDWSKGILISSAGRPRHLLEYPYYPENFQLYLQTQLQLAQELQIHTQLNITIRNRPKDLGWDLKSMVEKLKNPKITIEFQKGLFKDRLQNCALHICDNFSTTIVESLQHNHPTLILITSDYFAMHPDAMDAFKALARVGILHHRKEDLVNKLDQTRDNLLAWWNQSETQAAIKHFLLNQARDGANIWTWIKLLEEEK